MRNILFLLVVFLLIIRGQTMAIKPECVFVKGGKLKYKDLNTRVESFNISKYEVTNTKYAEFLNAEKIGSDGIFKEMQMINISTADLQLEYINAAWQPKSGKENYPMVMVSYYGANEFCRWMGGKLPTEMQWYFAAKGGRKTKNYVYAGSNNLDEVGWYKGNCEGHSHEVGQKKPNELEIYDMSGNAWEWCLNDSLKSDEDFCVHMGGSWFPGEQPSQISAHYGNQPTHFSNSVGFRIVFSLEERNDK